MISACSSQFIFQKQWADWKFYNFTLEIEIFASEKFLSDSASFIFTFGFPSIVTYTKIEWS